MVHTSSMIDFDFSYYDEMKYLCLKNCFYQSMDYLGVDYPLLQLKVGLSLKVLFNQDNNTFDVFKHNALMPLFDMDIIQYGFGSSFKEQFEINLEILPVIVLADVYYLPYRQEYKKYHASHSVFLTKYDSALREVEIIDWYAPYFFKGSIPLDDFELARISYNPKDINPFSGFAIKNYWYKIQKKDIKDDVSQTIHKNILDIEGVELKKNRDVYAGYHAFKKIKAFMEGCLADTEINLSEACRHIHDELFVFYRATILAVRYFEMARSMKDSPVIDSIIKAIITIRNTMEKLNFYLLKGSVSCSGQTFEKSIRLIDVLCHTYGGLEGD